MGKIGNRAGGSGRERVGAAKRGRASQVVFSLCARDEVERVRSIGPEPVLCPMLALVPRKDAIVFASLPLGDANALLLRALSTLDGLPPSRRPCAAAFFAAD